MTVPCRVACRVVRRVVFIHSTLAALGSSAIQILLLNVFLYRAIQRRFVGRNVEALASMSRASGETPGVGCRVLSRVDGKHGGGRPGASRVRRNQRKSRFAVLLPRVRVVFRVVSCEQGRRGSDRRGVAASCVMCSRSGLVGSWSRLLYGDRVGQLLGGLVGQHVQVWVFVPCCGRG